MTQSIEAWVRANWKTLATLIVAALAALGFSYVTPSQRWAAQTVRDAQQDTALSRHAADHMTNERAILQRLDSISRIQSTELLARCLGTQDRFVRALLTCADREGRR